MKRLTYLIVALLVAFAACKKPETVIPSDGSKDPVENPSKDPGASVDPGASEDPGTSEDPSGEASVDPGTSEDPSAEPSEDPVEIKVELETYDAEDINLYEAMVYGRAVIDNLPEGYNFECFFFFDKDYKIAEDIYKHGSECSIAISSDVNWSEGADLDVFLDGLDYDTKYYYVLLAVVVDEHNDTYKVYYGNVKSFKTAACGEYAEAVDLGLSVKWCDVNIGAMGPTEDGLYFAWGETKEKYKFTPGNYALYDSDENLTNYKGDGSGDSKKKLQLGDDAAYKLLGRSWRMPTADECQELIDNCTWEYIEQFNCWKVSRNGKSIYLPVISLYDETGMHSSYGKLVFYWTSTLNWDDPDLAYVMALNTTWFKPNNTQYLDHDSPRFYGCPIRAVARE